MSIGINSKNPQELLNTVDEIINNQNSLKDFKSRRDTSLNNKIDVIAFIVSFIENYIRSVQIMMHNSEYKIILNKKNNAL